MKCVSKSTSGKQPRKSTFGTIWHTLRLCLAPHFLHILVVLNSAIHNIASIEENAQKASNSSWYGGISAKIEHNFAPSALLSWSIANQSWEKFIPLKENRRMDICFKGWIDEKKWNHNMKQVYGENSYSQVIGKCHRIPHALGDFFFKSQYSFHITISTDADNTENIHHRAMRNPS